LSGFVGGKAKLEQFKEVIKNTKGQAVLVVGQAKTMERKYI